MAIDDALGHGELQRRGLAEQRQTQYTTAPGPLVLFLRLDCWRRWRGWVRRWPCWWWRWWRPLGPFHRVEVDHGHADVSPLDQLTLPAVQLPPHAVVTGGVERVLEHEGRRRLAGHYWWWYAARAVITAARADEWPLPARGPVVPRVAAGQRLEERALQGPRPQQE